MAQHSSFLPEDYLEKRIARRTNTICLALFMVVMAGVVAAWFVTGRQVSQVRQQRAEVRQQLTDKAKQLEQIEQLTQQRQTMVRKAAVSAVLVERIPRDRLLSELINHMPASMGLLELELSTEVLRIAPQPKTSMEREAKTSRRNKTAEAAEAPPPELQPTQVSLDLVGLAPTDVEVAQFMAALSSHPMFHDVNLQYSEQTTIDEHEVRKFKIEMTINQDLDLTEVEKTMVARPLKQNPMSDKLQINAPPINSVAPTSDRQ
ncbi:MAG: PilN domain-containing protein [Phycisphaeraceae bacterium]|nr:PilN domain-containing protein [Phycisphaeraceae bacterium]